MTPHEHKARGAWLLVLLGLVPALLGVERPPGLGDVEAIRTWSYPEYTRVVLELSEEPAFDLEFDPKGQMDGIVRLPANAAAKRPERLYLDVPEVWVGRKFDAPIELGDGLLEGIRLGQNTLRNTRLVIDLERYDHHRIFTLASPHRVVIDVYGERSENRGKSGAGPQPASDSASTGDREGSGRLPAELRRVHTIVVDPGHGGRDPGAIGVAGLREKNVNLAIAKKLAAELTRRGFEVVLTRDEDRTISLEERTAIAESAAGGGFISIHANASRRSAARGFETYTLDASHQRHTLDVAARENGVPAKRLDPLQRALAQIQVGEVASHSEALATFVHEGVMKEAQQRDRSLPDLGVKKGPFYVLFMSSMSSVLLETGFVTNKRDAKLLRSKKYQDMLAIEIAEGVDRYRRQIESGLIGMTDIPAERRTRMRAAR